MEKTPDGHSCLPGLDCVANELTALVQSLEHEVDKALSSHHDSVKRILAALQRCDAEAAAAKPLLHLEAPGPKNGLVPRERNGLMIAEPPPSAATVSTLPSTEVEKVVAIGKQDRQLDKVSSMHVSFPDGVRDDGFSPLSAPSSARTTGTKQFSMSYEDYENQQRALTLKRGSTDHERVPVEHLWSEASEQSRSRIWHFVHASQFQLFYAVVILVNSAFFGLEAEYMSSEGLEESPVGFQVANHIFSAAFLLEWVLRVAADGRDFFFKEGERTWNFLDTTLVCLSLVDVTLQITFGSTGGTSSLSLVRMVRSLRLVRIIRIVRVLRFFRSLRLLILAMISTVKSLIWTLLLLLTLMYMFAVLFTQAAHNHTLELNLLDEQHADLRSAWGSVPRSVYSLFKSITNGNSWDAVAKPLGKIHGTWLALFLLYIAVTYFAVLNVVTGVFCQMAIEGAGKDQDEIVQELLKSKGQYVSQLRNIFAAVDANRSGKVSIQEFQGLMKKPELIKFFATLEIDVEDAWSLFKLLDTSGDGEIDVDEFVTGCLKLRGQARSVDLALLQHQVKWLSHKFTRFCEYAEASLERQLNVPPPPPMPPPLATAEIDLPDQEITFLARM